jgi:hypothetical protein
VALFGNCAHTVVCLGGYALQPARASGGRPVYRKGAEDRFLWFFGGEWKVGPEERVGTGSCWMFVRDAALHPGAITGVWEEGLPGHGWVDAPGVKAVGGGAWPAAAVAHTVV